MPLTPGGSLPLICTQQCRQTPRAIRGLHDVQHVVLISRCMLRRRWRHACRTPHARSGLPAPSPRRRQSGRVTLPPPASSAPAAVEPAAAAVLAFKPPVPRLRRPTAVSIIPSFLSARRMAAMDCNSQRQAVATTAAAAAGDSNICIISTSTSTSTSSSSSMQQVLRHRRACRSLQVHSSQLPQVSIAGNRGA